MTTWTRRSAAPALALALALGLSGCADDSDAGADDAAEPAGAVAPADVAGFEEFPVGDDVQAGPLNIAGVYFQPVDMEPAGMGLDASEADIHIEADISALENDLGYGIGAFVPNLTVDYEIIDADGEVSSGTFMPMNASDGPHYGANIVVGDAGTYTVRFLVHSPEQLGHVLHVDDVTGVPGSFWDEPLVAEWEFDYIPRDW